jgi:hypothetical protein
VKYLALIHSDEQAWAALPDRERSAIYAGYRAFEEDARASGKLVEGYELKPTSTATTVRVVEGETLVTDGPFAELREQIAGYFILDCASFDEALALAARIPGAAHGAVEVRPSYVDEETAAA